jgi:hypothetical protein
MGKDLRTTSVQMRLHRAPKIDGTAWNLKTLQPFLPCYEKLFKTDTVSSLCEYGIRLGDEAVSVVDEHHIRTEKGKTVPVHRKTTMILSPFKWMRGDYGVFGLPKQEKVAKDMQEKLQSPHTAAYVGALTSIALSESGCIHFPKVYGVYAGLATQHTIDISDDYEELSERRWFADNLGKTFDLKMRTVEGETEFSHTRGQRASVHLGDEAQLDGIEDIDADHVSNPSRTSRSMAASQDSSEEYANSESHEDDEDVFDIQSCGCESESDDEEDDEEDEEEEEPFAWATFCDAPVVTTVMEACEGTFYDLLKLHSEPEKHAAWVGQLVMALAFAQRTFGLTHNDLHGNNVMYVPTTQEYLYYKHIGVSYQIPTYGYIIKVIDFDRAIVSLRLTGMKETRQFVSSQFHESEEASGQYNVDPFFLQEHPHIPPSASFDLCRFATSMFWDMFPEGPDHSYTHPLFGVFKQWMTQSDGSSVMFRAKRDNHDRYHGFALYKAIARYCRDAIPRREISKLGLYKTATVPLGSPCLFIES